MSKLQFYLCIWINKFNFMKELKYLLKFYKKYRWRFALGIFFVVTSNVFALYPAIYTRKAFDAAKETIESSQNSRFRFFII